MYEIKILKKIKYFLKKVKVIPLIDTRTHETFIWKMKMAKKNGKKKYKLNIPLRLFEQLKKSLSLNKRTS